MATAAVPDEWFASSLAPPAVDPLAPPPPPKVGGFADILAAGFGAGPDRMGAYQKGLDSGSQYRLRTAQTESALAEAAKRRAEALRQSQINKLISDAQANPNFSPGVTDLLTMATGANDFSNARLGMQEFGNRETLADTAAAPEAQFAAGQGVQGRMLPRIEPLGSGREIDMLTQEASTNPIGAAQIQNYRERPAGGFTLGGVRYDANGQPIVAVDDAAANAAAVAEAVARARAAGNPTTGAGKPLTEFQVKAMSQLSRMDRTEQLLKGPEFASYSPSLADVAMDAVPGVGNYAVSNEFQQYKQLANEWISGLLRLDSGAAVPETEFKRYFTSFFPQPGDGPDTVTQKAAARQAATAALRSGLPQIAASIDASRVPGGKPMPPEAELQNAAARRGVTVEQLKQQLRAKGYQ